MDTSEYKDNQYDLTLSLEHEYFNRIQQLYGPVGLHRINPNYDVHRVFQLHEQEPFNTGSNVILADIPMIPLLKRITKLVPDAITSCCHYDAFCYAHLLFTYDGFQKMMLTLKELSRENKQYTLMQYLMCETESTVFMNDQEESLELQVHMSLEPEDISKVVDMWDQVIPTSF